MTFNERMVPVYGISQIDTSLKLLNDQVTSLNFNGEFERTKVYKQVQEIVPGDAIHYSSDLNSEDLIPPVIVSYVDDDYVTDSNGIETETVGYYIYYINNAGDEVLFTQGSTYSDGGWNPTANLVTSYENTAFSNYGTDGWALTKYGNAIFSNVYVRGEMHATSGSIEGILTIGIPDKNPIELGQDITIGGASYSGLKINENNYFVIKNSDDPAKTLTTAEITDLSIDSNQSKITLGGITNNPFSPGNLITIYGFTGNNDVLNNTFIVTEVTTNTVSFNSVRLTAQAATSVSGVEVEKIDNTSSYANTYSRITVSTLAIENVPNISAKKIIYTTTTNHGYNIGETVNVYGITNADLVDFNTEIVVNFAPTTTTFGTIGFYDITTPQTYNLTGTPRVYKPVAATTAIFNVGSATNYMRYDSSTDILNVTGTINANNGTIGGFTIGPSSLYAGTSSPNYVGIIPGSLPFFAGATNTSGANAKFSVTNAGVLSATGANITGTINANAGTFTNTVNIGGATSGTLQVGGTTNIKIVGTNSAQTTAIYSGTTTFESGGFWMDADGRLSLGTIGTAGLSWNGTAFTVKGTVNATAGYFQTGYFGGTTSGWQVTSNTLASTSQSQVTRTGSGTIGVSSITVSSPGNVNGIYPAMRVSGTGIATGAYVTSSSGTTVNLSLPNTGAVSGTVTFSPVAVYLYNGTGTTDVPKITISNDSTSKGAFVSATTPFYADGAGRFSLLDKLFFDPVDAQSFGTLTVIGRIRGAIENTQIVPTDSGTFTVTTLQNTVNNVTTTGTGTSGQSTITVGSASNIFVGQLVSGTGIGSGARVVNISGVTITLSVANSANVSGTITFSSQTAVMTTSASHTFAIGDTVIVSGLVSPLTDFNGAWYIDAKAATTFTISRVPTTTSASTYSGLTGSARVRELTLGLHAALNGSPAGLGIRLDENNYWFLNNQFKVGTSASYVKWDGTSLTTTGTINALAGNFSNTVYIGTNSTGSSNIQLIGTGTATSTAIAVGTGTLGFNTSNTKFWVDAAGNFSLGTALKYEAATSTLTITGQSNIATYAQPSAPTAPPTIVDGSVWFDTDNNNKAYRYNSSLSSWIAVIDAIAPSTDVQVNAATNQITTISGGLITTGIIMSNGFTLGADPVFSSTGTRFVLSSGELRSKNFAITSSGDAYFKDGFFSGKLSIGGKKDSGGINYLVQPIYFGLNVRPKEDGIYYNLDNYWLKDSSGYVRFAIGSTDRNGDHVGVSYEGGTLSVTGEINANSGYLGGENGWEISNLGILSSGEGSGYIGLASVAADIQSYSPQPLIASAFILDDEYAGYYDSAEPGAFANYGYAYVKIPIDQVCFSDARYDDEVIAGELVTKNQKIQEALIGNSITFGTGWTNTNSGTGTLSSKVIPVEDANNLMAAFYPAVPADGDVDGYESDISVDSMTISGTTTKTITINTDAQHNLKPRTLKSVQNTVTNSSFIQHSSITDIAVGMKLIQYPGTTVTIPDGTYIRSISGSASPYTITLTKSVTIPLGTNVYYVETIDIEDLPTNSFYNTVKTLNDVQVITTPTTTSFTVETTDTQIYASGTAYDFVNNYYAYSPTLYNSRHVWVSLPTDQSYPIFVLHSGATYDADGEIVSILGLVEGYYSTGIGTAQVPVATTTAGVPTVIWAGSENPSSAGFKITGTGGIYANSGNIAGWTIGTSALTGGTGLFGLSTTGYPFFAGSTTPSAAPFRVSSTGVLTSTSGSIGGWNIYSDNLQSNGNTIQLNTNGLIYFNNNAGYVGISGGEMYVSYNGNNLRLESDFRVKSQTIRSNQSGGTVNMRISDDSNASIQRVTSSYHIKDNIQYLSDYSVLSNSIPTEKLNGQSSLNPFDVLQITPVTFHSILEDDRNELFVGFISQDVAEKMPLIGEYNQEGDATFYNINGIVACLLAVIQEREQTITDIQNRLAALEG